VGGNKGDVSRKLWRCFASHKMSSATTHSDRNDFHRYRVEMMKCYLGCCSGLDGMCCWGDERAEDRRRCLMYDDDGGD